MIEDSQPVRIVEIHIPFGQLVWLMFKICMASVPVVIMVGLVYMVLAGIIVGMSQP